MSDNWHMNDDCFLSLFLLSSLFVWLLQIIFSCSLSQTVTKRINILNPTDNSVNYLLLFLNNANKFFTILKSTSVLYVQARDISQVKIQFHAKKIQKMQGKDHIQSLFSFEIERNVSPDLITWDNCVIFAISIIFSQKLDKIYT